MAFPQQAPAVEAIQEARRLIAAGDRPRAVRVLEAFLARMPPGWRPRTETKEELQVAFWTMEEFLQFAALHQAAGDRRKVTWVRPAYGEACYLLGYLAVEEGDYAAARRHVERGLGLEPDHPLLLCELGMIEGGACRHGEALDCYRRAADSRPWTPPPVVARALRGVGFSLIELGELDRAEEAFRQSLELEPGNTTARKELEIVGLMRKTGVTAGQLKRQIHHSK
jgi:tetratricopeptide (TPR) repeat protein